MNQLFLEFICSVLFLMNWTSYFDWVLIIFQRKTDALLCLNVTVRTSVCQYNCNVPWLPRPKLLAKPEPRSSLPRENSEPRLPSKRLLWLLHSHQLLSNLDIFRYLPSPFNSFFYLRTLFQNTVLILFYEAGLLSKIGTDHPGDYSRRSLSEIDQLRLKKRDIERERGRGREGEREKIRQKKNRPFCLLYWFHGRLTLLGHFVNI